VRRAGAAALLCLAAAAAAAVAAPEPAPRPAPRAGVAPGFAAPMPDHRPAKAPAAAPRTPVATVRSTPAGLALCDDPRLRGARVPGIDDEGRCGIAQPVRLSAVAGVRFTRPVTVGCEVARTLADWVESEARPAAMAETGEALVAMTPAAGYACRGRNRQADARLSQHALGRAIDISGFVLAGGREITVERAWHDDDRPFAMRLWRSACGPFGTVLGPDSDAYHYNHFHFDIARYSYGPYCR